MIELKIEPRFNETDALGHINNTVVFEWFEMARRPIFEIFTPDLDPKKWRLIIARNEVDYLEQIHFGYDVMVNTYLSKIGSSSMIVEHELFQKSKKVAHCKVVMIQFNYQTNSSERIGEEERAKLEKILK